MRHTRAELIAVAWILAGLLLLVAAAGMLALTGAGT
jgi:hypothetical protein